MFIIIIIVHFLPVETPPPGYMSEDGDTNDNSMEASQNGSEYGMLRFHFFP